jgi:hypothetical protein
MSKRYNEIGIITVEPGEKVYVNLRAWGAEYYEKLNLENKYTIKYVVEGEYTQWSYRNHRKIDMKCRLFKEVYIWTAVDVLLYGNQKRLEAGMILVDDEFCRNHPDILNE